MRHSTPWADLTLPTLAAPMLDLHLAAAARFISWALSISAAKCMHWRVIERILSHKSMLLLGWQRLQFS